MPHDVKGRKIEKGDFVKLKTCVGPTIGQVGAVNEAAVFYNITVSHMLPGVTIWGPFNAGEAELVMKADGSDPNGPEAQRDVSPA